MIGKKFVDFLAQTFACYSSGVFGVANDLPKATLQALQAGSSRLQPAILNANFAEIVLIFL